MAGVDHGWPVVVRNNSMRRALRRRVRRIWHDCCVLRALFMVFRVLTDLPSWCGLLFRPRISLGAEILFLRIDSPFFAETCPSKSTRRVAPP
jgi:hypothetical protein